MYTGLSLSCFGQFQMDNQVHMQALPEVYEYSDFREYLKAYYRAKKERTRTFSYRSLARLGRWSSPSYFKMVADGKRNLSYQGIKKFIRALGLSGSEVHYFENLVFLNQTDDPHEESERIKRLIQIKSKKQSSAVPFQIKQYELLTRWYLLVIRELLVLKDFKEDPTWIVGRLDHKISKDEAREGIALLIDLGLVARNEQGRLELTKKGMTTQSGVNPAAVRQYHKNMIKRALDAVRQPADERQLEALTIALSPAQLKFVKEELLSFRLRLHQRLSEIKDPKTEVYQLNLNLFKLTKSLKIERN